MFYKYIYYIFFCKRVILQCVHKVPSGFWKIVARKQIELATCGLRQITVKLWKTRIRNAISAIPADMLHRTWQELEYRLDILRATKGAHIEVDWGQ
jgi:hypothetical protein